MSEYYDLPYTGSEVAADLAKVHDKASLVEDAPSDGVAYAQSDGEWAASSIDQLSTVLDVIKGDETGDDLGGKLKEIVTSKLMIKKALTDAEVENVGDVLRSYAEMIATLGEKQWFTIDYTGATGGSYTLFSYKKAFVHIDHWRLVGTIHHSYIFNGLTTLKSLRHIYSDNTKADGTSLSTCTALEEVSDFRLPNATTTKEMFRGCSALKKAIGISAPLSIDASYMFIYCSALTSVSLDLPSVTDASYMFQNCSALTSVSLDLPSVTDASSMFGSCSALTSVSLDLPSVTDASYMFYSCSALTSVSLDLPSVTNASYMFYSCSALTEISLDLPSVTNASYMFNYSTKLIKASLDVSSVTTFDDSVSFYYCSAIRFLLLKNLGKSSKTSYSLSSYLTKWGVEDATIPLSSGARQSLIDTLITYSYDRASAGMSACTITLSSTTKALLTSTEIAQITAKGFTLS